MTDAIKTLDFSSCEKLRRVQSTSSWRDVNFWKNFALQSWEEDLWTVSCHHSIAAAVCVETCVQPRTRIEFRACCCSQVHVIRCHRVCLMLGREKIVCSPRPVSLQRAHRHRLVSQLSVAISSLLCMIAMAQSSRWRTLTSSGWLSTLSAANNDMVWRLYQLAPVFPIRVPTTPCLHCTRTN